MQTTFADKYPSRSTIFIWSNKFKKGYESVGDDSQSGRFLTSIINANIVKIRNLVRSDRRLIIREMVDEINLSFYTVQLILTEN